MKLKTIFKITNFLFLVFFIFSCKRELPAISVNQKEKEDPSFIKQRLKQATLIMAATMKEENLANEFNNIIATRIEFNANNDEALSMYSIVHNKFPIASSFSEKFIRIYKEKFFSGNYPNSESFKSVTEKVKEEIAATQSNTNAPVNSSSQGPDDIIFMTSDGVQIYFPYSDNFINSRETVAFTYYPLREQEIVTAYKIVDDNLISFDADDDYAFNHPVYVLNYTGADCILASCPIGIDSFPPPPPPPPRSTCQTMEYNTVGDYINDLYVVSVAMPKIRLTEQYRSWVGGSNYISLNQLYAIPRNLSIDSTNGSLAVSDTNRVVISRFQIKRKAVIKKQYVDFGQIWNGDWRLLQYNNAMLISYEGGFLSNTSGGLNFNVNAGIKYDTSQHRWVPQFDAGVDLRVHIDFDKRWKEDGTDYISRRDALAHIVGDTFGNGTALDAGETIPWTVRKCGHVLYYFKNVICY